jgi:hydroxymethylpyrimidine/phosphomethylpyrimidine kinase
MHTPRVLSIAGSDSGGGAGIQADLKAFAACGVHGMTAITAITAQNTVGVDAVQPIAPEIVIAQVKAVVTDIGVDAVKIGMLGDTATIVAVSEALDLLPDQTPIVVDPVMVAESGARLLDEDAVQALRTKIVSRATVVTPNLPEARVLAGEGEGDQAGPGARVLAAADEREAGEPEASVLARAEAGEPEDLARKVRALGADVVVVTGGHREQAVDVFFDGDRLEELAGERYEHGAAHGSGCTHSSTLAACLARGETPLEAAEKARKAAGEAVRNGLQDIGAGAGPVDALGIKARRESALPLT